MALYKKQVITKVLSGHTSAETAYVVNDYPYGFRLRCKIRYWLEFKKGFGFRFCSQTTNPKITTSEVWNKPKSSTYEPLAAMYLDEEGHVKWNGLSIYDHEHLEEFVSDHAAAMNTPAHIEYIAGMRAAISRRAARLATTAA